jgi:ribonuclease H2 subunit A
MVYSVFYVPTPIEKPLLAETHHFDDSKALTPAVRAALMAALSEPDSDLHAACGYGVTALSARAIGAAMLAPATAGAYNLNAQAQDATVALIQGVLDRGVRLGHVYVDTIGQPAAYQRRLERFFPQLRFTVAKKADSLYPCVSAASVVAKVTRDVALEVAWEEFVRRRRMEGVEVPETEGAMGWGSGYPSDARCTTWLKQNVDPLFGWGSECRFSWGTIKELLEKAKLDVDWPEEENDEMQISGYFNKKDEGEELAGWFGQRAGVDAF